MGSYIELGFWFEGESDNEVLGLLARALVAEGGTVLPEVQVLGADVPDEFRSVTDGSRHLVELGAADLSLADLLAIGERVVAVDVVEVVSYTDEPAQLRLSYTSSPARRHPLVVLLPDEVDWDKSPSARSIVGIEVRRLFEALCHRHDPIYAGLFVEFGIPEPAGVNGSGHMFRDAYFSRSAFDSRDLGAIEDELGLSGESGEGLWVFSTPAFGEVNCSLSGGYGRLVERAISRIAHASS